MSRTHSLDNLRTYLTALVVVHHASIPYGGLGSWMYESSQARHVSGSCIPISAFIVVNQTYFMALFFLLSGYFSAGAARKRSRLVFMREKWIRLGVPTALYSLISKGLIDGIIVGVRDKKAWDRVGEAVFQGAKSVGGVRGPVWYCALLLIFDCIYVAVRPGHFGATAAASRAPVRTQQNNEGIEDDTEPKPPASIPTLHVVQALVLTSVSAFFIRLYYPIGTEFKPLALNLGYLPQYAVFYVAGIYIRAHLGIPLHTAISRHTIIILWLCAFGMTVYGVGFVHSRVDEDSTSTGDMMQLGRGGWNVMALLYAGWNECLGVILSSLLLDTFSSRSFLQHRWAVANHDVTRYSYAAFLVHAVVLVSLQCLLDEWEAGAVVKSAVVGALGVMGSWISGWVLVKAMGWVGVNNVI